jgi:hypothetical protein
MPAVLTHKTIMLLARERLGQIRDALQARKNTSGIVHTDLDNKIFALAKRAYDIMSEPPHPTTDLPGQPFIRPLGEGISKFAVMGAMGPDITAFSAMLAPGQAWLFDTVHKGNPDANREMVAASTCEFAIQLWRRMSTSTTDERKLKMLRAYVLGHLCHLAGDIISHPFINDLEWHFPGDPGNKLDHADGESSHDAIVAQKILLRRSTREGAAWDAWWPTVDEVPTEFFTAYAEALEDIYHARTRPPAGFREFEEHHQALDPPSLTSDFIFSGYKMYRNGIVSIGYGHGTWDWVAFLLPLFIPIMLLPVVAAALPNSRQLFRDPQPGDDESKGWLEMFALPTAVGSAIAGYYGIRIAALTTKGVGVRTGFGITLAAISFVLGVIALIMSGTSSVADWARWLLLGIPALISIVQILLGFIDSKRDGYGMRSALGFIYGMPLVVLIVAGLLCILVYRVMLKGVSNRGLDSLAFWIATLLWSSLWLFGVSLPLARYKLRDAKIPELPRFPTEKPHHVRLFDDNALYSDPAVAAPNLADRFFPSSRRKLLKLWWEGSGDMFVRVDRFQLVFSFTDSEGANKQILPAPVAPMTLVQFIHLLENRVKDAAGHTGSLKGAVIFREDLDYELPPGATFADHGDDQKILSNHFREAIKFKKLGTTEEGTDYILYHARKPEQSIRFGKTGPVNNPFGRDDASLIAEEANTGYQYVFDPNAVGESDTIMGYAADFAALLCMGGASQMETSPANRIHQVFRNWCLDRRRENEWRMLVAGGAFSEKGSNPDRFDPLMLRPPSPDDYRAPLGAASPDAIAEGERTARELGWVPLLRQWLDITRRPTVDPLADTRLHPDNATNRALNRGMAFLLDMSDPARVV